MRRGTRNALGCASVIVMGMVGIVALAVMAPLMLRSTFSGDAPEVEDAPGPAPTARPRPWSTESPRPRVDPEADPERYLPYVESRQGFSRSEQNGVYRLNYGFIDHHGRSVDVSCAIDRREHEAAVAAFGYAEDTLQAELNGRLNRAAREQLDQIQLSRFVALSFYGWGSYKWQFSPEGARPSEYDRIAAGRDTFARWMEREVPSLRDRIHDEILARHGFLREDDTVRIDYASLTVRNAAAVADCARALAEAASQANDRRALGLFVAFLQELRYELPPDVLDGREILGLWVPSEVLLNAHGDCDSKAVAFCVLWRHRGARTLVLDLPGHSLVAVEGKPQKGEHFIRLGNRYFLLCEVAGPGKLHPGARAVSGNYRYVEIPPL